MRTSPSIVPNGADQDTYLVLDDFGGRLGCAWRETDVDSARRDALIRDLLAGEYKNPARIVAFNTAEGWSRDATKEIADELRRCCVEYDEVPARASGRRASSINDKKAAQRVAFETLRGCSRTTSARLHPPSAR